MPRLLLTPEICWHDISFRRFLEGVASAACSSMLIGILMVLFPKYEASIPAYTEMLLGLGYMLGEYDLNDLYKRLGINLMFGYYRSGSRVSDL